MTLKELYGAIEDRRRQYSRQLGVPLVEVNTDMGRQKWLYKHLEGVYWTNGEFYFPVNFIRPKSEACEAYTFKEDYDIWYKGPLHNREWVPSRQQIKQHNLQLFRDASWPQHNFRSRAEHPVEAFVIQVLAGVWSALP